MDTSDKTGDDEYEGAISVVMPGQIKASTYRMRVKAPDRVTAHALIEDLWRTAIDEFGITVTKVKPGTPAPSGRD